MSRPRLGIVLTELGIGSEVWALRQARAFAAVEPVPFGWSLAPGTAAPTDIETPLFDAPFARPATRARRLGLSGQPGLSGGAQAHAAAAGLSGRGGALPDRDAARHRTSARP